MIRRQFLLALLALAVSGYAVPNSAHAQDTIFENKKIVPYVPSPQYVVDKMIDLAGVKPGDLVYDLGSGDGRIVITAAKRGAQAAGFEIDGDLVGESRENIKKAGVEALAEIRHQDILTVDFSAATVVTMYLLPDVNLQLKPNLRANSNPARGSSRTPLIWGTGSRTKSSRSKGEPFIFGRFPPSRVKAPDDSNHPYPIRGKPIAHR